VLKQRVITALILMGVLVGALLWSPNAVLGLVTLVIAFTLLEWLQLAGWTKPAAAGAAIVYSAGLLAFGYMAPHLADAIGPGVTVVATIIWIGIAFWLTRSQVVARPLPRPVTALAAIVLVGAAWLALLHFLQLGMLTLVSVLFIVWLADTAAYFAGRAWGRRKLAPHISPGKTWAGVYGAMAAVLLTATLAWWFAPEAALFSNNLFTALGWLALVPLLLLVTASVVGDLYESLIKRQANVKDSGQILPGHGGVFDRVDAMVPSLPVAALVDWMVR
jgi:phosphatidate cytidylyltransferase